MYKLYWSEDSGALAPQIALEEIGVDYERCDIDLEVEAETEADYLAVNPRGQIPALVLADGTVLTESAAILLHLAETHANAGLLPAAGSTARAVLYRWLFFAAANLYEGVLRLYYSDRYTSEPTQTAGVEVAARDFIDSNWALLEDAIAGPYFLGDQYSVIDPYLLMLCNWHEQPEKLFADNPKLAALCQAVRERPAVQGIWSQHFPE